MNFELYSWKKKKVCMIFLLIIFLCTTIDKTSQIIFYKIKFFFMYTRTDIVWFGFNFLLNFYCVRVFWRQMPVSPLLVLDSIAPNKGTDNTLAFFGICEQNKDLPSGSNAASFSEHLYLLLLQSTEVRPRTTEHLQVQRCINDHPTTRSRRIRKKTTVAENHYL